MVFRDKLNVNHQFMVIGGILAINDFTPSIDGEQWYLGIIWLLTINPSFLIVFREKLTFNHQFMVIGDICPMYDFALSLDGERWYIMTLNYQTMGNAGIIY